MHARLVVLLSLGSSMVGATFVACGTSSSSSPAPAGSAGADAASSMVTTPDGASSVSDASDAVMDATAALDATSLPLPLDDASNVQRVVLSMTPSATINPHLYGSNYDWHATPATQLAAYDSFMRKTASYTLARYPGGFDSENYDWSTNTEKDWNKWDGGPPGPTPAALLAVVPEASFVTPSADAVKDAAAIDAGSQLAVSLVTQYGSSVKIWEIGNEWFNQGNAQSDPTTRARNLRNYAAFVAAVAPALKAADSSIQVYATGEWTVLSDFSTLQSLVGPAAWASVDGISIHPYCGTDATTPPTLCSSIPAQVAAIKSASGKNRVFASEWAVTRTDTAVSMDDVGVRNASQLVLAIQSLALGGVNAATYWPPSSSEIPQLAFGSEDYSAAQFDGVVFGWMSTSYRGQALTTSGPLAAAAALASDGSVSVIIPSMTSGFSTIEIPLSGTGLTSVVSAEVLFDAIPQDAAIASDPPITATLPTELVATEDGGVAVRFVVNPGTAGRGAEWEIARVTLH